MSAVTIKIRKPVRVGDYILEEGDIIRVYPRIEEKEDDDEEELDEEEDDREDDEDEKKKEKKKEQRSRFRR